MKYGVVLTLFLATVNAYTAPSEPAKKSSPEADGFVIQGSLHKMVADLKDHVIVPGFIATKRQPPIARIVGPVRNFTSYSISERIYLSWDGSPAPRVGDYYSIYTPALTLQNKYDPKEFQTILDKGPGQEIPENYRLAGYLFEPNGEVKITDVNRGVVTAIITHAQKQINLGDRLMLPMPQFDSIEPVESGPELTATIMSGSPPERMSPTLGSFIYINRGSSDGVKIGRVFELLETVTLTDNPLIAPTESMGEVKVVYTTEFFSTALVTKQFNTMRMGANLVTKSGNGKVHDPKEHYQAQQRRVVTTQLNNVIEKNLTPKQKLSELDELERRAGVLGLTPEERKRLEDLQRQDLRKKNEPEATEGNEGASTETVPSLPTAPKGTAEVGSVATGKKPAPKKKKKNSGQDEAGLNQLMQF